MQSCRKAFLDAAIQMLFMLFLADCPLFVGAQTEIKSPAIQAVAQSRFADARDDAGPTSENYKQGTTTISARMEHMGREQRHNACAVA